MKNNIIIELKDEVIDSVIKLSNETIVDFKHLPFNNFKVLMIMSTDGLDNSMNSMLKLKETGMFNHLKDEDFEKAVKQMVLIDEHKIYFDVEIIDKTMNFISDTNDKYSITMKDYEVDMSKAITEEHFPIEDVQTDTNMNDEIYHYELVNNMNVALGVLGFFQSDKKTIKCTKKLIPIEQKRKNKRKKKNQKRYVYNTKYVFENTNIKDDQKEIEKREYTRHIEQWFTRGHWRVSKTGKRSWIKPRVNKAHEKNNNTNNQIQYKITNIK